MIEENSRPTAFRVARGLPFMLGIPFLTRSHIQDIRGRDQVESVVISGPKGSREIAADGVIVTGKFQPDIALLRQSHLQMRLQRYHQTYNRQLNQDPLLSAKLLEIGELE
jgi:thioredoxin reductase